MFYGHARPYNFPDSTWWGHNKIRQIKTFIYNLSLLSSLTTLGQVRKVPLVFPHIIFK